MALDMYSEIQKIKYSTYKNKTSIIKLHMYLEMSKCICKHVMNEKIEVCFLCVCLYVHKNVGIRSCKGYGFINGDML